MKNKKENNIIYNYTKKFKTDIGFVNRKLYLKVQLGRTTEDIIDDCPKECLLTGNKVKAIYR